MAQKIINGLKISYRENTADESVLNHSFGNDIYLSNIKGYFPKAGNTIIDVGAHIGAFSIYAASFSKEIKIYAVEASKDTFDHLQKNVRENNFHNVFVYNFALSDSSGKTRLYHDLKSGNWGHSISKNVSETFEEVESVSLNDFIIQNKINSCDLMKLNCEGAEFKIILNTENKLLSQVIKRLIILYHEDLADETSYKDLISHLKKSNFATTILFKEKYRGWIIAQNKNLVPYPEVLQEKFYALSQKAGKIKNKIVNKIFYSH